MRSATMDRPMAKKTAKKAAPPPKAEEPTARRKPMVVQIRGSEDYKAWVEDLAGKEGFTVALLFERALRAYAKEHGYPDAPRR